MEQDYEANAVLDKYDEAGIDDEQQAELNLDERHEVDRRLD